MSFHSEYDIHMYVIIVQCLLNENELKLTCCQLLYALMNSSYSLPNPAGSVQAHDTVLKV